MNEKIIIALIGAAIALFFREIFEWFKRRTRRNKLVSLCIRHLKQIEEDLVNHVEIGESRARFEATQYCEVIVGDFLYDLFTSNIDVFSSVSSVEETVNFFHHYKSNMNTVRTRLASSTDNVAYLEEETYNNLLNKLRKSITELKTIISK